MKERRVCTSIIILLDGFIIMWSKKPDICRNTSSQGDHSLQKEKSTFYNNTTRRIHCYVEQELLNTSESKQQGSIFTQVSMYVLNRRLVYISHSVVCRYICVKIHLSALQMHNVTIVYIYIYIYTHTYTYTFINTHDALCMHIYIAMYITLDTSKS